MGHTAKSLRKRFFEDNAEFMLTEFRDLLQGKIEDFACKSAYAIQTAYPIIFKMIENASDVDASLAKSSNGIIQMLASGSINADQALELLKVLDGMLKVQAVELDLQIKNQMLELTRE